MTHQDSIVSIRDAWQALARQSLLPAVQERLAQRSGVSIPRTARLALGLLAERGELRISELASLSGVDISTMSRSLRHLDDADFIRREPGDDLRAVVVSITSAGRDAVAQTLAAAQELLREVLASWSASDHEELARLMSRFADDFAAHLAAAPGSVPVGARRA